MHASMRPTLLVHIPLFFLASLASAQTGEVRTGAAALAGALLVSDDANGTIFRVTRK